MQVVIDSVSIQHLLRSNKLSKIKRSERITEMIKTSLDSPLSQGKLKLAVDKDGGLIDEWSKTCGVDYIHVLVSKWEYIGVLTLISPVSKINPSVSKKLIALGFKNKTIDRLILRIALATKNRTVVSEDPDFWDPSDPSKRGNTSAPIARCCREHLEITVLLLSTLIRML